MIQIRNITRDTGLNRTISINTKFGGEAAYPLRIDLAPGDHVEIPQQNVIDWHTSIKQFLGEYVASGILKMYTIDSAHLYQDKGNNPIYDYDHLIDAPATLALTHALEMASTLHTQMNYHMAGVAVHNGAVGAIAGVAPTDLATLLVWLAAAEVAYNTNHRVSALAHDHPDTENAFVSAAVGLPTAVTDLRNLYSAYQSHKGWFTTAVELDVPAILTY